MDQENILFSSQIVVMIRIVESEELFGTTISTPTLPIQNYTTSIPTLTPIV